MVHDGRTRKVDGVIHLRACYSGVFSQIGRDHQDGVMMDLTPIPLGLNQFITSTSERRRERERANPPRRLPYPKHTEHDC